MGALCCWVVLLVELLEEYFVVATNILLVFTKTKYVHFL